MPKLFGLDVAKIVKDSVVAAGDILPAVLHKRTVGARTVGQLTGGTNPTFADYSARGVVSRFSAEEIEGTNVTADQKKVLLLGASIQGGQIPETDDEVTIEGTRYVVQVVLRDPAAATYVLGVT